MRNEELLVIASMLRIKQGRGNRTQTIPAPLVRPSSESLVIAVLCSQ